MSQDNLQKLTCTVCRNATYFTHKNRKKVDMVLNLNKYCKFCKKHTPHKEGKRK